MAATSFSYAWNSDRIIGFFLVSVFLAMPLLLQAQGSQGFDGPESLSYDPNYPGNIVTKWEGPWSNNEGWTYWRATMGDNSGTWIWDNGKGERRFGYDTNNDGRYESWQEELTIPGMPLFQIYHWDKNQDGTENAMAWAEGGVWLEKVWDSNNDGLIDSWCSYTQPGCAQYLMATDCNLGEKKAAFDTAYRNYLSVQSSSAILQKRAYANYQRADLIFRICKNINMR